MIAAAGIGTVIQARMGAKRLPDKVLLPILGRPMLGRVIDRHRLIRHGGRLVVATTTRAGDDPVAAFCEAEGVDCFRGSETDVLGRFCAAAAEYDLLHVIRGTGDNPLVDPVLGDELLELYCAEEADYGVSKSVDVDSGLPDGIGLEVFSRQALELSDRLGHQPHHREHINEYILENPGRFRVAVLRKATPSGSQGIRLTVDTAADLRRVERVYAHFDGRSEAISLEELLQVGKGLASGLEVPG